MISEIVSGTIILIGIVVAVVVTCAVVAGVSYLITKWRDRGD